MQSSEQHSKRIVGQSKLQTEKNSKLTSYRNNNQTEELES